MLKLIDVWRTQDANNHFDDALKYLVHGQIYASTGVWCRFYVPFSALTKKNPPERTPGLYTNSRRHAFPPPGRSVDFAIQRDRATLWSRKRGCPLGTLTVLASSLPILANHLLFWWWNSIPGTSDSASPIVGKNGCEQFHWEKWCLTGLGSQAAQRWRGPRHQIRLRYSLSFCIWASYFGMLQWGLAMPIRTSNQMSVPLASEMWMSAVRTARASHASGWLSLGRGKDCSEVATAPCSWCTSAESPSACCADIFRVHFPNATKRTPYWQGTHIDTCVQAWAYALALAQACTDRSNQ